MKALNRLPAWMPSAGKYLTVFLCTGFFNSAFASQNLLSIQREWAQIEYGQLDDDGKIKALEKLENEATGLVEASSDSEKAGFLIWRGIIRSTEAGIDGGIGALSLVKDARSDLQTSLKIDNTALQGSALTSLGALYYQVPGWPLAFGDDNKARTYLEQAVKVNPNGIDSNYFYGDFLASQGENHKAIDVLKTALKAPARPDRPLADRGRRQEIQKLIEKLIEKLEPSL
ncbi:tetratricopeptide repeat protein [Endozoicomonas numazuensis]|uniref:Uncharacterized protein n=1 Tax=Endozoicomonas numazuensis TaxID=1137799 RepID=A0A081NJ88_9GAMM|nr:hypothetical protein [Endozoicomonas numazuensis]KEQ18511.1 hypothetical protein GZ78_13595 [Endozoicomonas numazuensis]